eukprot:5358588-Pleurochrysis_carterae.AAC.1
MKVGNGLAESPSSRLVGLPCTAYMKETQLSSSFMPDKLTGLGVVSRRNHQVSRRDLSMETLVSPDDGGSFADGALCRLEHWHLPERALLQEGGGLVVGAHLKGRHVDLDAIVFCDNKALQRVRVARVRVECERHGCCGCAGGVRSARSGVAQDAERKCVGSAGYVGNRASVGERSFTMKSRNIQFILFKDWSLRSI